MSTGIPLDKICDVAYDAGMGNTPSNIHDIGLIISLPKTADGYFCTLGQKVYYPYSIDCMAGPHAVFIRRIDADHGWFSEGKKDPESDWIGVSWDSLFYLRANADKQRKANCK